MSYRRHFDKHGIVAKTWNSVWVGCPMWFISAICVAHWYHNPPSPGKAIGALAVVAGIMSVREMKVLGKAAWVMLLIALLSVEFKAIDKDRAENDAKQAAFFESQKAGFSLVTGQAQANFSETASHLSLTLSGLDRVIRGIDRTLKAADTTIRQTRPQAYVTFNEFYFQQSPEETWANGHPFGVVIRFKNFGTIPASDVYKFAKFYLEENSDEGIERAFKLFETDYESEKKGPSVLAPQVERLSPEIEAGFSREQMREVQQGSKRIVFLFRADYKDATGRWRNSVCRTVNPLMTGPGVVDEDQCKPYNGVNYNEPRAKIP